MYRPSVVASAMRRGAITLTCVLFSALPFAAESAPIASKGKPSARSVTALPRTAPLPQPRPKPAPAIRAAVAPTADAPASGCVQRLAAGIAVAPSRPAIAGPGACGSGDMVSLEAIWLRGGHRVTLQPPADLRCGMAEAVAHWVRDDLVPAIGSGGAPLAAITVAASYHCRSRNNVRGGKMSEHGLANALDIGALKLADGKHVDLTDPTVAMALRQKAQVSACSRFTTVLGPGSDGHHEKHIHLDLLQRPSGYRLCSWAVLEPDREAPTVVARAPADVPTTGATPLPRPASRTRLAARVPASDALPQVRLGRDQVKLPVARPKPVAAKPPAAKPPATAQRRAKRQRPRADRSASCPVGQACPRSTSRRRARGPRPATVQPLEALRAIFRW